jgi:hypothetical protein
MERAPKPVASAQNVAHAKQGPANARPAPLLHFCATTPRPVGVTIELGELMPDLRPQKLRRSPNLKGALSVSLLSFWLCWSFPLSAQYPGQYPPGQYPPGQYPGGQGAGIPIPHLPGKKKKPTTDDQVQNDPNAVKAEGTVLKIDQKSMVLVTGDSRRFTLTLDDKTKYVKAAPSDANGGSSGTKDSASSGSNTSKPTPSQTIKLADIETGSLVSFVATPDSNDNLVARIVVLEKATEPTMSNPTGEQAPPLEPRKAEDEGAPRSNQVMTQVAPPEPTGRPHLTRGAKPGQAEEPDDTPTASSNDGLTFEKGADATKPKPDEYTERLPPPPPPDDDKYGLIQKARDWIATFSSSLPNYICQQVTTRYQLESKTTGWQAMDLVSAEVVYENGQEDYRKITINGKPVNKGMMEIPGSRSTGEYGTTLRSLFYEGTRTHFKASGPARTSGKEAIVYDFRVAQMNSGWEIGQGGQTITPAYSGSVWIEKGTGHVLRIEMQADQIPKTFPLDKVETVVEYDMVRLTGDSFLLPVHSENLACERGTPYCSRNVIDFRNYHKFGTDSTITFSK